MSIDIPEDYVVEKFFRFVGAPEKNKYNNTYQGSCPICREGSSWLRKRRFYYIPKIKRCYCHNCGFNATTLKWIMDVSGLSLKEIKDEINDSSLEITLEESQPNNKSIIIESLPKDCINLSDNLQLEYYKNNKIVKSALDLLNSRMLNLAVNKPKAFYLSLTDKVHKNRLILPFFDENNKIIYYQSRTILDRDNYLKPRYISKIGGEKSIFNIDNIDNRYEYLFIFEGPINSCFVKNGIAIGGIQENSYQLYTLKQLEQINRYPFHNKVWVLDSQWKDKAALNKTKKLLELNEDVFIWPKELGQVCKDFNDIAIKIKSGEISPDFILKNTNKNR